MDIFTTIKIISMIVILVCSIISWAAKQDAKKTSLKTVDDNVIQDEVNQINDINEFGQRSETEIENRYFYKGYIALPLILFIIAFFMILLSLMTSENLSEHTEPVFFFTIGLVSSVIGLFFLFFKKKNKISEIKQYKGSVKIINHLEGSVSIGNQLSANIPTYWIKYLSNYLDHKNNNEHQISIRQDNNYVVQIDNTFSIEKESYYGVTSQWKRPLIFLLMSIVMLSITIFNSDSLEGDLAFTQYYFTENKTINIDNNNPVNGVSDYKIGDWVVINTIGQCDVNTINQRCNNLLINANPIQNIAIPPYIKQLTQLPEISSVRDDDAIDYETQYNVQLEYQAQVKYQLQQLLNTYSSSYNNYGYHPRPRANKVYDMTKVTNFPDIVNNLNDFCNTYQQVNCRDINNTIIDFVYDSAEDIADQSDWNKFVENINNQSDFIIRHSNINVFKEELNSNISRILTNELTTTINEIKQQQGNDGIWFNIYYDSEQIQNYHNFKLPYIRETKDGLELLTRITNMIEQPDGLSFKARGIISDISKNDNDQYVISINSDEIQRITGTYFPTPVIRTTLLIILSLFAGLQFLQFVRQYGKQKVFIKEIDKLYS